MRSSELPPKLLRHFYILDLWAFGVKNVIGQSRDHCTLWGQKITPFYFTLPCETKHKFVHNGSNVSFKSHGSYGETRHSNCSKCLLLGLRLQLKLCWLLTTFESDAASAHRRLSLVSACQFQSVSPASAIYWCGFHAARSESEWCILLWCLAAQTAAARHLSSCWRLLLSRAPTCTRAQEYWAAATRALDFTPDIMALLTDQTSVL